MSLLSKIELIKPLKKPFLFGLLALFTLFGFLYFYFSKQINELNQLEYHILRSYNKDRNENIKHRNKSKISSYEEIFSFPLLEKEKIALETLSHYLNLDSTLKERLNYLTDQNHFSFVSKEKDIIALAHPIQLDENDLRQLLERFEEQGTFGFHQFSLSKKSISEEREVYECDFSIIRLEENK